MINSSRRNRGPGAQKPEAGHPSPTRILLRVLLWFWLSVMVSLITLLAIMLSGYAPGLLRSSVTVWVEDQTGASLEIGSLSGSLWSGFDLRDIRLSGIQEKSELNISRLHTKLRLRRSLLVRRLVLQELVVERLHLTLRRGVAGDWWISGLGPVSESGKSSAPTETPGNPGFEIERFALEAARVEWGIALGATPPAADLQSDPGALSPQPSPARTSLRLVSQISIEAGPVLWPITSAQLEAVTASLTLFDLSYSAWTPTPGSNVFAKPADQSLERFTAEAQLSLSESTIRLSRSSFTGPGGTGTLQGEAKLGNRDQTDWLSQLELLFTLENVNLAQLGAPWLSLESNLNGRLKVESPTDDRSPDQELDFQFELDDSELAGEMLSGGRLEGNLSLSGRDWELADLELGWAGGRVTAHGHGDFGGWETFEASGADLAMTKIPNLALPLDLQAGDLTAKVSIRGPWEAPLGSILLRAEDLRGDWVGSINLDSTLSLPGNRSLQLDRLLVRTGGSEALAQSTVGDESELHSDTRRVLLRATQPATLSATEGGLAIEGLDLNWGEGSVEVNGGWDREGSLPLHVRVNSLDLNFLPVPWAEAGRPEGSLSGEIDLTGPAGNRTIVGEFKIEKPGWWGIKGDHIEARLEAVAPEASLRGYVSSGGRRTLDLSARLPWPPTRNLEQLERKADWTIEARDFSLDWLAPWLKTLSGDARAHGLVNGRLEGRHRKGEPSVNGTLEVLELSVVDASSNDATPIKWLDASRVEIKGLGDRLEASARGITTPRGKANLEASINWTGYTLGQGVIVAAKGAVLGESKSPKGPQIGEFALEITRRDAHWFDLRLSAKDLATRPVVSLAEPNLDLAGRLSARLQVKGHLETGPTIGFVKLEDAQLGNVEAESIEAQFSGDETEQKLTLELVRDGERELQAHMIWPGSLGSLMMTGPRPETWSDASLSVGAHAFDLDWLALLLPSLPLSSRGQADGHLTISDFGDTPKVLGDLQISQGVFSLPGGRASIGPVNGTVQFQDRDILLENMQLSSGRGTAKLEGRVIDPWHASRSLELAIVFDDYRFDQLGFVRARLDGRVSANGPLNALDVSGQLDLGRIRMAFPTSENPVLKEIRVLSGPHAGTDFREDEELLPRVDETARIDIGLRLPPGTWVRGMGLDAEVVGLVRIQQQPGSKRSYRGQLALEHGRYRLAGKRFDLTSGTAVFRGNEHPIPYVDISAERQATSDVRVTAHLTGPANAPKLDLTSDPPLDRAEILSYVFVGEAQTGQSTGDASDLAHAAGALAGNVLLQSLPEDLQDALMIDQISVTSGEDGGPPVLEIESQLTPWIYLRLTQSLGDADDESAEIRYRIWRDLSLRTILKRSGDSIIDLLWSYDYWGLEALGFRGLTPPPPPSASHDFESSSTGQSQHPGTTH